ncbi:MHYT domain-containing protein [Nodosilinea sp. E11]|uniref:MHYT domain-containing protein n=1 Tax=Nodosilinea sp. E11 TaxID=3037479 RepID=UPI0029344FFD|nr:MHYT domain-containing protein [Nodosilinea sp. E11]WOD40718.1 MHYT domain-containing protein [Nodosilinea sp. E11]
MAYAVVGHYNAGLVGLSFGVAILASYTTLSLGRQILATTGWRQWPWLIGGALAMGTGIWATHFIAMLALEMSMPVSYDLLLTVRSLVYGVLTAGVALAVVSRSGVSKLSLGAGGTIMGLAIAWMHYTGMGALEMAAQISYQWWLVALSVAVAMVASTIALGVTLRSQQSPLQGKSWSANLAVPALGIAVGGLHYTGMAGTLFQPSALPVSAMGLEANLDTRWLAVAVGLGAGVILVITLIVLKVNQRLAQRQLEEEALAHSEQRFRSLIREMGVGVLLLNANAEILISNQAARQFLGLPETSHSDLRFGQTGIICQDDGSPFLATELPVQRAICQKAPIGDVVIGVRANQTAPLRWLLVNVDPQLSALGEVERVVCTCSDITMQKQAEAAVRAVANREKTVMRIVQRMRQTLDLETIFATTTAELQQAVNCDRVWIYRFNPDWSGTVVAENLADLDAPSTLLIPGSSQQLIDQSDCSARQMQNSAFDEGYLLLEDTYLQETQAETYRQDRTYHRVNDIYSEGFDTCYLEFLEQWQVRAYVIVPIFAGNQLWGLLGIYAHHQPRTWSRHEVKTVLQVGTHLGTAVQQADLLRQTQQQAEALAIAKRAADAASQAKGEFLASMSHELRTPLNAILGFTQILHDDATLKGDHRDLIDIVNRSGNHLLELINNVLSLAKIEANKITLDEAAFDLHQILQAVEDMLQLKAEVRGIRLEVVPPPPLPYRLWADQGKLRQILINLIGNAIKFTAQGSVTVRASIQSRPMPRASDSTKTHWLEVVVQDTGVGIDPGELAQLFQPFEQTQSGRLSAEGSGLGLSLSRNFAQLMGGSITVHSRPGEGSMFTVNLPVGIVTAPLEPVSASRAIARLAPQQPTRRILVADDAAESRLLMRHWLEAVGFEVREARHGQEAIDTWRTWQPHMICLDMRMPVLDGYGVARQVRQLPGGEATIIVAVTASVFEEQRSDCIAAGCNAVLPKPLQRSVLLEHVAHSLGLTYQYVDAIEADSKSAQRAIFCRDQSRTPLTKDDFSGLSTDWLGQLHQAAQAADDRQVRQLIAQLPADYQALAQRLDCLVDDFRLDVIIDLTAVSTESISL